MSDQALQPAELVEREERLLPRAGTMAIVAGLATFAAAVAYALIFADLPRVLLVDALRDSAGLDIGREGLTTDRVLFFDDKALPILASSVVRALGAIATAFALVALYDATRARRAETPRYARGMAIFGGLAIATSDFVIQGSYVISASDFAGQADKSTQAAEDALETGAVAAGQVFALAGGFALALAFVLICLNAMRAGLLTRFLGILGVIVGGLIIFPIGSQLPIVQSFFLVALGLLLLGRMQRPPAWAQGVAIPWPSQQEVRERAELERDARAPEEPRERTEAPSPSTSSKKKRKRRG